MLLFEETKLQLIDEPVLLDAVDILRVPGKHIVRLTYLGTIDGTPEIDTEESNEYQWISLEELNALDDFDMYAKDLLRRKTF